MADSSRPNAFITIPISNPEIKKRIEELQEAMIQHSPGLKDCMQKTEGLHLTVDVHYIQGEDIEKSKLALQELGKQIENDILQHGPLSITFEGLKSFFDPKSPKVVYACIKMGQELSRLNQWKTFQKNVFHYSHKIYSKAGRDTWSPHITIAKIKAKNKEATLTHIPVESFDSSKDKHFGLQDIDLIELRSMDRDENDVPIILAKYDLKSGTFTAMAPSVKQAVDLSVKGQQNEDANASSSSYDTTSAEGKPFVAFTGTGYSLGGPSSSKQASGTSSLLSLGNSNPSDQPSTSTSASGNSQAGSSHVPSSDIQAAASAFGTTNVGAEASATPGEEKFPCPVCSKPFTQVAMDQHLDEHF